MTFDAPRRYWKEQRDRRLQKRKMYRKMLLFNKREREAAFHDKDTVFAPSESSRKGRRNSKWSLSFSLHFRRRGDGAGVTLGGAGRAVAVPGTTPRRWRGSQNFVLPRSPAHRTSRRR